jgi:ribonuclease HII
MKETMKCVIGIDEAGRGPLAGPVSVGVVMVPQGFDWNLIPGVNDSKKLSEKKREEIYARALELTAVGKLWYSVQMPSAKVIDRSGIAPAIRAAMACGLTEVMSPKPPKAAGGLIGKSTRLNLEPGEVMVKLDGSLYAPAEFVFQETIIKGDAKEKVIGLASIMAKVTRDRYMVKIASKPVYEAYNFARHKGYGTLLHRAAIAKYGLSPEHRASYCKNIQML